MENKRSRLFHAVVVAGAALGAAACSSTTTGTDSGPGVDMPAPVDSGSDALAMNDLGSDAGATDAGHDAGGSDAGSQDLGVDSFVAIL